MHFTRLIRRAGPEYKDAADSLAANGKLELVAGSLVRVAPCRGDSVFFEYTDSGGRSAAHPMRFPLVVNCFGFEKLTAKSSSRLLRSLIVNNICKVNSTTRGFEVNDRLEAANDLYIIGPLLAGAFTSQLQCWHFETARRIVPVGAMLARNLLNDWPTYCDGKGRGAFQST
jgi:uncharacterized NAD(P)/FAD-binding protein YdhS